MRRSHYEPVAPSTIAAVPRSPNTSRAPRLSFENLESGIVSPLSSARARFYAVESSVRSGADDEPEDPMDDGETDADVDEDPMDISRDSGQMYYTR